MGREEERLKKNRTSGGLFYLFTIIIAESLAMNRLEVCSVIHPVCFIVCFWHFEHPAGGAVGDDDDKNDPGIINAHT